MPALLVLADQSVQFGDIANPEKDERGSRQGRGPNGRLPRPTWRLFGQTIRQAIQLLLADRFVKREEAKRDTRARIAECGFITRMADIAGAFADLGLNPVNLCLRRALHATNTGCIAFERRRRNIFRSECHLITRLKGTP